MKKGRWKTKIKDACVSAGTYRSYFDQIIEILAEIMEKRDDTEELYQKSGGNPIIVHTNKAGAKNIVKHPAIVLWDDLNKSALAYWRDLGLTPSGLKKIDETALKKKKGNALSEALKELGG